MNIDIVNSFFTTFKVHESQTVEVKNPQEKMSKRGIRIYPMGFEDMEMILDFYELKADSLEELITEFQKDKLEVIAAGAVSMDCAVYDSNNKKSTISPRLLFIMQDHMGRKSESGETNKITDILVSEDSIFDSEITYGIKINKLKSEDWAWFHNFITKTLNFKLGEYNNFLIGLDLSSDDSFINPIYTEPTYDSVRGKFVSEQGAASLSNRNLLIAVF